MNSTVIAMRTSIKRIGNSAGVLLPKVMLGEIGAKPGDEIDLSIKDETIVLALCKRSARDGWAEAAEAIGTDEDDVVWPEFRTVDDETWIW